MLVESGAFAAPRVRNFRESPCVGRAVRLRRILGSPWWRPRQERRSGLGSRKRSEAKGEGMGERSLDGAIAVRIPYERPCRYDLLVDFLRFRAIKGVEVVDESGRYARTCAIGDDTGWITVENDDAASESRYAFPPRSPLTPTTSRVARVFCSIPIATLPPSPPHLRISMHASTGATASRACAFRAASSRSRCRCAPFWGSRSR